MIRFLSVSVEPFQFSSRQVGVAYELSYVGHLHLLPITKDDTTFAEWSSSWESDSEDAVEFCHTIYVAFLDEMANSLG
jgi:hypothetical protein